MNPRMIPHVRAHKCSILVHFETVCIKSRSHIHAPQQTPAGGIPAGGCHCTRVTAAGATTGAPQRASPRHARLPSSHNGGAPKKASPRRSRRRLALHALRFRRLLLMPRRQPAPGAGGLRLPRGCWTLAFRLPLPRSESVFRAQAQAQLRMDVYVPDVRATVHRPLAHAAGRGLV